MAQDEAQQERRRDSVAIPRTTVKAASWLASISFMGVSAFIWNLGAEMDVLTRQVNVLELRVKVLEDFADDGGRFTETDGKKMERRIERMEQVCSDHRDLTAHREQKQLNKEIFWRLEKLEKPGSDNGTGAYRQ
jgi:hypothetical protein